MPPPFFLNHTVTKSITGLFIVGHYSCFGTSKMSILFVPGSPPFISGAVPTSSGYFIQSLQPCWKNLRWGVQYWGSLTPSLCLEHVWGYFCLDEPMGKISKNTHVFFNFVLYFWFFFFSPDHLDSDFYTRLGFWWPPTNYWLFWSSNRTPTWWAPTGLWMTSGRYRLLIELSI